MPDPIPGVLSEDDLRRYRALFGVGEEQVRRDHVISHSLAALAELDTDRLVFFGGTALSRTHLPDLRLSEDIDLIASSNRSALARDLQRVLTRHLRRSFGTPSFTPDIDLTRSPAPTLMRVSDVTIQIQILGSEGCPAWPTEVVQIDQRYADAPPAHLRVLTPSAFSAAKLSAWHDRHAERDLYDLWALASRGFVGTEAARLFSRLGPITDAGRVAFDELPTTAEWNTALAHQCVVQVDPQEAAAVARDAWARVSA